jgi:hypothetical protein
MDAAARSVARIGRLVLSAFYAAPWTWLLAFGVLFTLALAQFGHVPSYGNPDPKQVAGTWVPYWAIYLLLIPTLLSPAIVLTETVVRLVTKSGIRARALAGYAVGFALFASIAFADAFGLMNWLLD